MDQPSAGRSRTFRRPTFAEEGSEPEIILEIIRTLFNMSTKRNLSVAGYPVRETTRTKSTQAKQYPRHIRQIYINTPTGYERATALFDTGANIFVLSQQWVRKFNMQRIERDEPINVFGFSGEQNQFIGSQFTPFLLLKIGEYQTPISAVLGNLENEIDIIISGGWFLIQHPMTFELEGIQIKEHHCDITEDIEYDETVLDDPEAAVIGSMTYFEPPDAEGLRKIIPKPYHSFLNLFGEKLAAQLPPHRNFDHAIDLQPGTEVPFGPIYPLSEPQREVLREYLDRMIREGKIQSSKSPAGAPILFVPKKNGKLRMCIDYRGLNNVTIKNRYPLPLMDTLREQVSKAKVFSKLDLRDGYYLIRIKEGDEWKTAFRTRYGHFEYKVMPFGLCNTPATFQNMIHEVLREFLDQGVVVYLDDILVYSETEEEHVKLLTKVFMCLAKYNLAVAVHKSVFHVPEVEFLGYIVNGTGISVSGETTQAIRDWEVPKNLRGVRAFIGFANFYRRFIRNFSSIVRPITNLTKKDVKWHWGPEQQNAFDTLLTAFSTPPILRHYDPRTDVIIETDASNFAIGCVLSQD